MRWIVPALSFLVVFACTFAVAGWVIRPHVPPVPARNVYFTEWWFWATNWPGFVLGLALAGLSARSAVISAKRPQLRQAGTSAEG